MISLERCGLQRRISALILFSVLASVVRAAELSHSPVLAISTFKTIDTKLNDQDYEAVVARDKVVSDLVRQYTCYVCSRSRGYNLALEETRWDLAALDRPEEARNILVADYVISGLFRLREGQLECQVLYANLNAETDAPPSEIRFFAPNIAAAVTSVPARIAAALSLPSVRGAVDKKVSAKDETWVVLPFSVILPELLSQSDNRERDPRYRNLDTELALRTELALQESGLIGRLVDHVSLEAVLKELKIVSMTGANENLGGTVAQLVGADRVVMGAVSRIFTGWRLDVFVVDGRTASILAARSVECHNTEALLEQAGKLVAELAAQGRAPPEYSSASAEQRAREAAFYMSQADQGSAPLSEWMPSSYGDSIVANAEAAYLLERDNPQLTYRIARALLNRIIRNPSLWWDFAPGFSREAHRRAAWIAADVLRSVPECPATPSPSIHRARALILLQDYDEAASCLQKFLESKPGLDRAAANLLLAKCRFEQGDVGQAQSLLDESVREWGSTEDSEKLSRNIAEKRQDERGLYELMKNEEKAYRNDPYHVGRFVPLMRKYDGPETALEYLKARASGTRPSTQFIGEWARAADALGRTNEAVLWCRYLLFWNDMENSYPPADYFTLWNLDEERQATEWARERLSALGPQNNVQDDYQMPGSVHPVPDKYAIYLLPDTNADIALVKAAAGIVSRALGTPVTVLPGVALPVAALDKTAERLKYRSLLLAQAMLCEADIPSNALFVVCVTGEQIGPTNYLNVADQRTRETISFDSDSQYLAIATYHPWMDAVPSKDVPKYVAEQTAHVVEGLFVSRFIRYSKRSSVCEHYPCALWSVFNNRARRSLIRRQAYFRFSLCPECQEHYRQADFARWARDFQGYVAALKDAAVAGGGCASWITPAGADSRVIRDPESTSPTRGAGFYGTEQLARQALDRGDLERAKSYAERWLQMAPENSNSWNYGNALHNGNLILGQVALAQGNMAEARRYLLEAGRTSGSPQLLAIGPGFRLAAELLNRGERETVLQYLELCRRFWRNGQAQLDQWMADIRSGRTPVFEGSRNY